MKFGSTVRSNSWYQHVLTNSINLNYQVIQALQGRSKQKFVRNDGRCRFTAKMGARRYCVPHQEFTDRCIHAAHARYLHQMLILSDIHAAQGEESSRWTCKPAQQGDRIWSAAATSCSAIRPGSNTASSCARGHRPHAAASSKSELTEL